MNRSQTEYNQFTRWLTAVDNAENIPPQYDRYKDEILECFLAFKVPIKKERRDLRPGDLMYTSVVGLCDKAIHIWLYETNTVLAAKIPYTEIVSIRLVRDLLDGNLIIRTNLDKHIINFNTSHMTILDRMVADIRKRYISTDYKVDLAVFKNEIAVDSAHMLSIAENLMEGINHRIIAYQPFVYLDRASLDGLMFDIVGTPMLQDSLFVATEQELVVINRMDEVKDAAIDDFGIKVAYVPLEKIKSFVISDVPHVDKLSVLSIRTSNQDLVLNVGDSIKHEQFEPLIQI